MVAPAVVATFGCFAYAQPSNERIRLHFLNVETDGRSPLAIDRVKERRAELAALFEHVKRQFLDRLERRSSLDGLDQCSPFQPLALDAF
jgi:hypothetical protein